MKDHERYELLYGRPIGVEDPVLEALRKQSHQVQGGIYVEPGRTARESSGFLPNTSANGGLSTHERDSFDGQSRPPLPPLSLASRREFVSVLKAGDTANEPSDSESRRWTNLVSFQRYCSWLYAHLIFPT